MVKDVRPIAFQCGFRQHWEQLGIKPGDHVAVLVHAL